MLIRTFSPYINHWMMNTWLIQMLTQWYSVPWLQHNTFIYKTMFCCRKYEWTTDDNVDLIQLSDTSADLPQVMSKILINNPLEVSSMKPHEKFIMTSNNLYIHIYQFKTYTFEVLRNRSLLRNTKMLIVLPPWWITYT